MKIIIKGVEYEYNSDHPNGWDLTPQNHFKCPVDIGQYRCFIKRFEKKNIDDIPGWDLLLSLKGKNEPNLPGLYDIVPEKENGRDTYYVFFEYLEGTTLDKLIDQKASVSLTKLMDDLFRAFYPIHIKNYWVTDFSEKNIFCEKDGRFLQIDIHHTHSMLDQPITDLVGDNGYWKLVFNFYREILHQRNLKADDINGSSINYLQIVFLLLRLDIFYKENPAYGSEELLKVLPRRLDEISPSFRDVYSNVFRSSELALPSRDVARIKTLALEMLQKEDPPHVIEEHITPEKTVVPAKAHPPEILFFTIDDYTPDEEGIYAVQDGEPFKLNWAVQNGAHTELYRNEIQYSVLDKSQKDIELKEFYNGGENRITYKLLTSSPDGEFSGKAIRLRVKQPVKITPVIQQFAIVGYVEKQGNEYYVNSGKDFTVNWKVKDAERIEIYKDGSLYSKPANNEQSLVLNEVFEHIDKRLDYTLQATNGYALSVSDTLTILVKEPPGAPSEIVSFTASNYVVENQQAYTLAWRIKNVSNLQLYRNGKLYKTLNPVDKTIMLREAFDDNGDRIEYTLHAANKFGEIKSTSVEIKLKPKKVATPPGATGAPGRTPYLKIAGAILGVALILALAKWAVVNFRHPKTVITSVSPQNLYEDSSITIYGKELSDSRTLDVLFNGQSGKIVSFGRDSLVVTIPDLKNNIPKSGDVNVSVRANGYDVYLHNFLWFDRSALAVKAVKTADFFLDSTVTLYCNNLSNAGEIKVYFNYIKAKIKSQDGDSLIVSVPETIMDSIPKSVKLNVKDGIKSIYTYNFVP